jgi:hypothetical protein
LWFERSGQFLPNGFASLVHTDLLTPKSAFLRVAVLRRALIKVPENMKITLLG